MLTLVLAGLMSMMPTPVIPNGPLTVSWNQSPKGAGGARMTANRAIHQWSCGISHTVRIARRYDTVTGVMIVRGHPVPFFSQVARDQYDTYNDSLSLYQDGGPPSLTLNTRSGVISSAHGQAPSAPHLPGFVLTNYTAAPFLLEFTCDDAQTAAGWRTVGSPPALNPLVITISAP